MGKYSLLRAFVFVGAFESNDDYILYSSQYNTFMFLLRVAKSYSPKARKFIEDLIEKKGNDILKELTIYRDGIRFGEGNEKGTSVLEELSHYRHGLSSSCNLSPKHFNY